MANPSPVSHFHQPVITNLASPHPLPKSFQPAMVPLGGKWVGSFYPSATSEMVSLYPQQLLNKSMSMFQGLLYSSLSRLWAIMLPTSSGEANGQGRFQERAFYKALTSKANRFVKKFVKTQLFSLFIQVEKEQEPSLQVCSESFLSTASQVRCGPSEGREEHFWEVHKTAVILSNGVGKKGPEAARKCLQGWRFVDVALFHQPVGGPLLSVLV